MKRIPGEPESDSGWYLLVVPEKGDYTGDGKFGAAHILERFGPRVPRRVTLTGQKLKAFANDKTKSANEASGG
jgi:hypothetical protein